MASDAREYATTSVSSLGSEAPLEVRGRQATADSQVVRAVYITTHPSCCGRSCRPLLSACAESCGSKTGVGMKRLHSRHTDHCGKLLCKVKHMTGSFAWATAAAAPATAIAT